MQRITTYWLSLIALLLLPLGVTAQTVILEESFDEITSGSNTSNPRFASLARWQGNENILSPKEVYQADKAILVGSPSNSRVGSFELKELDLSGNAGAFDVTLEIKGCHTNKSGILKVSIVGNDESAQEYLPVKYRGDEWETHTFSFAGGQRTTTIRVETLNNTDGNYKGVFINNLVVSQKQGEPTLVADIKAVDFRRININSTSVRQVELTGTNLTAPIDTDIQGTGKEAFKVAEKTNVGDQHTLSLQFTPTAGKTYDATLHISSGDLALDIPLTGVGVDPQNPYGLDPNATPIETLNEPFTNDPLLAGWREIAFEGEVHWMHAMPYDGEPVMSIEAAGTGLKARSALITPLVKAPERNYKTVLTADYRVGSAKGGELLIKRFDKQGNLISLLKSIIPTEPTEGIAYKSTPLSIPIKSDGKDSYFVFEYIGDDSPENEAERKTLTILLDNVKLSSEEILEPVITTDLEQIDFGSIDKGSKFVKAIVVTGEHITSRITAEVVGRDKDFFELDKLGLPAMGGTIQITLNGTKETALEATLVLTAKGEGDNMHATKEIPLVGKIVTSTQEVLADATPVHFTSEGLTIEHDASVALYSADGRLLLAGSYRAGDNLRIDYTGSVIVYVEGAAYKGTLR
ncbi:hypothetical protein [uncultured Porphyromonas sp.]|uniref:hypothetical protein n=1 Tax=uncultured Porphyromonas sp. TaxID=159274 RepID=UPI0025F033D7|nr:hypothetical protein [uncultured Porphyromonas sp.]